jgi:uncharacterized protein (TIGR00369 family)
MIGAQAAPQMSGMDYLQAALRGEFPIAPMAQLMNMRLTEVEEGRAVFTAEPGEYHYNPIGSVHGGFAATLLDSAMGCAVHSTLPAGAGYTTVELHINLLRPITTQTGIVRCEGKVIHAGRRIATAEARLTDETGKIYAHGTTTCVVFTPSENGK